LALAQYALGDTGACGAWHCAENPMPINDRGVSVRVSTAERTTRNQRCELHAVAERHGWEVVATYEDAGVSGAKGPRQTSRL